MLTHILYLHVYIGYVCKMNKLLALHSLCMCTTDLWIYHITDEEYIFMYKQSTVSNTIVLRSLVQQGNDYCVKSATNNDLLISTEIYMILLCATTECVYKHTPLVYHVLCSTF